MAIFEAEFDNNVKKVYIDTRLYGAINKKIIPDITKKDKDKVYIVDGAEGSGKSTFAMQFGKAIDPTLDLSRVCMTPDEFTKAVLKAKKGQVVIYDEAFTGLSSRQSWSEVNKLIASLMMEMRQKNLVVIIVMPTFFLLERYVALFRAKGLFHIYLKNGKRGRWMYFNNKKKKILYILGKKLFDYSKPKSQMRGRFYDQYVLNEDEYKLKKREALMSKTRSTKAQIFQNQRNILLYILNKKLNINQVQISLLCKQFSFNIERNTLSEIIAEMEKTIAISNLNFEG